MGVFAYRALDLNGSDQAGTVVADTPRQARDLLRQRGLTVTAVSAMPAERAACRNRGRAAQREVVAFIRELATLLRTGIPLLDALRILTDQHRRGFRAVVERLADDIAAGAGLAEAMERQGRYFDELCVSITRVGESTGSLETALRRLAEFKEKARRLRSRVGTALIYPAVVCAMGLAVTVFVMTYVVPNLLGTLTQAGKDLPAMTKAVKAASDFLVHWWWALGAGAIVAVAAVRAALATEPGRLAAAKSALKLPIIGELVRKETTSRIAVVLSALLRSGLPFVQALQITRGTVPNRVFGRALETYESAVAAGKDVAGPLRASGVFSPMVVHMLAVGQQSGELEDMLEQLADAFDHEVATAAARLAALLEPALIVLLALMVAFIAFATILPILEVSNVL